MEHGASTFTAIGFCFLSSAFFYVFKHHCEMGEVSGDLISCLLNCIFESGIKIVPFVSKLSRC